MKNTSNAIKVGISFIVLAVVLFVGFRFVKKGVGGGGGYRVYALFRDATGLVDKSQVQMAGLTIGEIAERRPARDQDWRLPPDKKPPAGAFAYISVRVQPGVQIWSNASVFKKTASLLGQYYLEIDPGTAVSPGPNGERINRLLGDNDRIENVVEAVTTTDILVQVNETLPILRQILLDVQKVTQGPLRDIAESVRSGVDRNSAAAERLLTDLDRIALDVKGITGGQANSDIKKSIANIRDITDSVKGLVGSGNNELSSTGEKIRTNLDKIGIAIDNLNRTMANAATVSDKIKDGEGTVGRLLNDDTIANNVEQITEDVGGFVKSITRLQTLVGLRSEYNVLANTLKTYVAVQLQSRPDKFFLIELVDDPRGSRSVSQTFTTTDDPSKPQTTSTSTVTTKDSFRITFQIGKRLFLAGGRFNLTGRFGIKESTGGIGLDAEIPLRLAASWFRTLTISADMFDFRTNTYPRLKLMAALEFFRHLWLVAGADDILNGSGPAAGGGTGRDYFIGGQLTFNDDDLRALLTIGGAALAGGAGR